MLEWYGRIRKALDDKKVVVLESNAEITSKGSTTKGHSGGEQVAKGLVGGHAYSVLGTKNVDGRFFLVVRNPWGKYGREYDWKAAKGSVAKPKDYAGEFLLELNDAYEALQEGDDRQLLSARAGVGYGEAMSDDLERIGEQQRRLPCRRSTRTPRGVSAATFASGRSNRRGHHDRGTAGWRDGVPARDAGTSPANAMGVPQAQRRRMAAPPVVRGRPRGRRRWAIGVELMGLPARDVACHGGSFPIVVDGVGCIGAVTVSGFPSGGPRARRRGARRALCVDLDDVRLD